MIVTSVTDAAAIDAVMNSTSYLTIKLKKHIGNTVGAVEQ